jgi:hypothetical protein
MNIVRWLLPLVVFVLAGCLGPLQLQPLPSDQERCAWQGGWYSAGICHTRGGP